VRYDWQDSDGTVHTDSPPFEAWVPIGTFMSRAECEGSDFTSLESLPPFSFSQKSGSYRIPLPLTGNVQAGAIGRWKIEVQSARSSLNRFRVVFQLADGRTAESRVVDLLYFKPQNYPESIRPFQPRC
jgi:hypothetical protein